MQEVPSSILGIPLNRFCFCVLYMYELCLDALQVDALDLPQIGPPFMVHAAFPARTNTEFVQARCLLSI